jgi:choline dehydrogenase-like flavoprotein
MANSGQPLLISSNPTGSSLVPATVEPIPRETSNPLDKFSTKGWATFLAIADTFAPAIDPEKLRPLVSGRYGAIAEDVASISPSSNEASFREQLAAALAPLPTESLNQLAMTLKLLSYRPTAMLFTHSTSLLTEMSQAHREQVLLMWHNSRIGPLRKIFRSFYDLTSASVLKANSNLYRAMGHPEVEPFLMDAERFVNREFFRFNILDLGPFSTQSELTVDIVIIGSGAGAGVAASRLARQGVKVLVLEKGKYFHQSELAFNEDTGYRNLLENGGSLATEDGSMTILSGASLGGGTTVNWSASLRTPDEIRQEWVEEGVPWYGETVYSDAMDLVMASMGCSADHIVHSFSNQLIMDGCAKLGYKHKAIEQNTGGHQHNCGFCCFGCRFGEKQGGIVYWLRDAVEHGAQILDQTDVLKIIHSGGKAVGVDSIVRNKTHLRVHSKKVIVAGGSLQTPGVLLRSHFKNRLIGKGLKLHPVTVVLGEFPKVETNPFEKAIMTAVCTEVDNLDGKHHGPKIESVLHQPILELHFVPWRGGDVYRQDQLRYNHLSAMLVITRDRSSGTVFYSPDRPLNPRIEYTPNKYDCWALQQGSIAAANLLYIQGAERIFPPESAVPIFECSKPVESRQLTDSDYQAWVNKLKAAVYEPLKTTMGSAHQMASCRMNNKGPRHSVANERGQLWECDNVYLADTSVFPTASGVNPMISVMATAHVIAGFVGEDLVCSRSKL